MFLLSLFLNIWRTLEFYWHTEAMVLLSKGFYQNSLSSKEKDDLYFILALENSPLLENLLKKKAHAL